MRRIRHPVCLLLSLLLAALLLAGPAVILLAGLRQDGKSGLAVGTSLHAKLVRPSMGPHLKKGAAPFSVAMPPPHWRVVCAVGQSQDSTQSYFDSLPLRGRSPPFPS